MSFLKLAYYGALRKGFWESEIYSKNFTQRAQRRKFVVRRLVCVSDMTRRLGQSPAASRIYFNDRQSMLRKFGSCYRCVYLALINTAIKRRRV